MLLSVSPGTLIDLADQREPFWGCCVHGHTAALLWAAACCAAVVIGNFGSHPAVLPVVIAIQMPRALLMGLEVDLSRAAISACRADLACRGTSRSDSCALVSARRGTDAHLLHVDRICVNVCSRSA